MARTKMSTASISLLPKAGQGAGGGDDGNGKARVLSEKFDSYGGTWGRWNGWEGDGTWNNGYGDNRNGDQPGNGCANQGGRQGQGQGSGYGGTWRPRSHTTYGDQGRLSGYGFEGAARSGCGSVPSPVRYPNYDSVGKP